MKLDLPEYIFAVGLRFYVASRLENVRAVRVLRDMLVREGHVQTYDWTVHGSVFKDGATREENTIAMAKTAHAEHAGIEQAEVVIIVLPGGKGTHTELGMALALNKPIIITTLDGVHPYYPRGKDKPCAFWFHQRVQHVEINDVVQAVRNLTVELRRPKTELRSEWRIGDLPMVSGLAGLIDGSSEPEAYT